MMKFESSSFGTIRDEGISAKNAVSKIFLNGQGATCVLYKINIHGKWVVLKRIKPEHTSNPLIIKCFEKEFEIGFNLDHPHIIKYLNRGVDEEGHYLITEFIEGKTLRDVLNEEPKGIGSRKKIKDILIQLLEAISYLHKKNIFHLDLKPENIIISEKSGNIKLIDFGFSYSDGNILFSGGTKKYSPAEQIKTSEKYNYKHDLYSLGLIVLEMYTGSIDKSKMSRLPLRYRLIVKSCLQVANSKEYRADDFLEQLKRYANKKQVWVISFTVIVLSVVVLIFQFNLPEQPGKPLPGLYNNNKWKVVSSLPQGRAGHAVALYKDLLFCISGDASANGLPLNTVLMWDLNTDEWSNKSPIPTARGEIGVVVYKKKIYTFGGWVGNKACDAVEVYDIEKDTWKALSPLPKSMSMVSAVMIKDKFYILGATTGTTNAHFYEYDPETNIYKSLPVFTISRGLIQLAIIDNKIYAAGGASYSNGMYHMHNNCDEYDPETNKWTEKTAIPVPVEAAGYLALDGKLHCFGGRTSMSFDYSCTNMHLTYSPEKDIWESAEPLPVNMWGNQAIAINEKIYLIGGFEKLPNASSKIFMLE